MLFVIPQVKSQRLAYKAKSDTYLENYWTITCTNWRLWTTGTMWTAIFGWDPTFIYKLKFITGMHQRSTPGFMSCSSTLHSQVDSEHYPSYVMYSLVLLMMWSVSGLIPLGSFSSARPKGISSPVSRFLIITLARISCFIHPQKRQHITVSQPAPLTISVTEVRKNRWEL